jgi:hypothetical protein
MTSLSDRNAQSWPEREQRIMRSIEERDVDLADLIGLVATNAPDTAAAAGHRARLDGYLALMAADTATRNAAAANRVASGIRWATWALVLATVALIVVTAFG